VPRNLFPSLDLLFGVLGTYQVCWESASLLSSFLLLFFFFFFVDVLIYVWIAYVRFDWFDGAAIVIPDIMCLPLYACCRPPSGVLL
jgi:hypothetical protein